MRLRVIEQPADLGRRRVFSGEQIPYVSKEAGGDEEFQCGSCDTVLVKHSLPWTIRNLAFQCPGCGAYNAHPDSSLLSD